MANSINIKDLDDITSAVAGDKIPIIDTSDTTDSASGTLKLATVAQVGSGGSGDMTAAVYDPTSVAADAFDVDNHVDGTTNKVYTATEKTKLSNIETAADVTDTANVTSAGALMDSEVTDLAGIKSLDTSTLQVKLAEGAFVDGDKTKLDGIEASADVTDTANVTSAGALMDSELTDLAGVKALDTSTLQVKPVEGAFVDGDKTKLDGIETGATADQSAGDIEGIVSHDNLQGVTANEHIDWTQDQGATNIHSGNYTDTDTTDHTAFSNIGTNTHAQIDTHIASTSNPHSVDKSDVGLGSVENTALSTWTGSANIATVAEGAVTAHEAALSITESQISDLDHDATKIQGVDVDATELASPSDGDILVYRSAGTDFVLEAKPASGSNPAAADITDATADGIALITSADANPFTDADESKLDGIEASADVTDTANVTSAGALMDSELTDLAGVKALDTSTLQVKPAEGAFVDGDKTKLDGIEASADVTDTANVTSAGALMDSEVDADIKTLSLPASTTISAFGATLIDDADQATAQATLDVDPSGTDNSTDVTLAGTPDYITITGQEITRNQIDLTADVTGVLPEANLPNASTSAEGVVELATSAETTTGTDTGRVITPDGLAGSTIFGQKVLQATVVDYTTDTSTGDGQFYYVIPEAMNGMNLIRVHATVISAGTTGTTDIQIHNVTDTQDMLSTKLTIDSGETGSDTAATAAVINTTYDDVATNDLLRVDVDAVSTTAAKGLILTMEFRLP